MPDAGPSTGVARRDAEASTSAASSGGGQRIGAYQFETEIGRGSFATVYRGHRVAKPNVDIAIKAVSRQKLTSKLLENLESEINILKAISHRHIVSLEECFKNDTHIYLVMEYCTGSDLSIYIKSRGKIATLDFEPRPSMYMLDAPASERRGMVYWPHPATGGIDERVTRSFLGQLAQALMFLRSQNLIHRDIKPQNLLLHPANSYELADGHPLGIPILKVADFGFARILPAAAMAETLCGSPLYMAPEILRYEKYDAKADLWSVGAVLFEMAVGKSPFRANNHVELLKRIEKNADRIKFPDESSRADTATNATGADAEPPIPVGEDIKALIRGLLKRRPADRMGFDEFFASKVWEPTLESSEESLSPDIVSTDSSDILAQTAHTSANAARVHELVRSAQLQRDARDAEDERERGRRVERGDAPGVASPTSPTAGRAPQPVSTDPALNPAPAPQPRMRPIPPFAAPPPSRATPTPVSPTTAGPTAPPAPAPAPAPRRSEPSYFVGTDRVVEPPAPTLTMPGGAEPLSRPRAASSATTASTATGAGAMTGLGIQGARPITRDRRYSGKEATSLEEPAPVTPSSGTTQMPLLRPRVSEGSPLAATPPITMVHEEAGTGKDTSALDGADSVLGREYVVVEKQTVEVNALADGELRLKCGDEMEGSSADVIELDQASKANTALVRRPSSRSSVVSRPVSAFKPPIHHTQSERERASIRPLSYSPPFGMSTTPPFAVAPTSTRRPSGGSLTRPPSIPQQLNVFPPPAIPGLSPDNLHSHSHSHRYGTSPSSLQTGALARALTNTAIRMIGQGANTAATALARAAQRSGRRPTIVRTGEMSAAEEDLLRSVEDVARKAFALFELGDERLGVWHALVRPASASGAAGAGGAASGSGSGTSPFSLGNPYAQTNTTTTLAGGTGAGGATRRKSSSSSLGPNSDVVALRQQEQAAGEAVVLYCKALAFIVQGTNRIQRYWEGRDVGDTSAELNEMVQWLRARFNECYEKAEWAKARCAEELPFVDRLLHDRARDSAALAELQGDLPAAQAGYETAIWLLMALLDDAMYEGSGSRIREEDRVSIEKVLVPVRTRLDALRRKAPTSPV